MENELKQLAEKLGQYQCVNKFDSESEPESWRLADSLLDLEGSFKNLLECELPRLKKANSESEVNDALLDIGEDLRHILYHIREPKFFSYLFDE